MADRADLFEVPIGDDDDDPASTNSDGSLTLAAQAMGEEKMAVFFAILL